MLLLYLKDFKTQEISSITKKSFILTCANNCKRENVLIQLCNVL